MRPEPGGAVGADAGGRFVPRPGLPPIGRLLRAARRGAGAGLVITGPPGSGKSAVLRAWEEEALREGGVLPLAVRVPASGCDLAQFASEALAAFGSRCLAFRSGLPEEAGGRLEGTLERLRGVWPEAADALGEAAHLLAGLPPGRSPSAELARVPERLARRTGVPVLLLLDDLDRLAGLGPPGRAVWCPEAARSACAPAVFTCRSGAPLGALLGPAASALGRVRLGPLPADAAERLLRQFSGPAGLALDEEARRAAVALSGGWPGYLRAIADAVGDGPGSGALDVARAYGASVAGGALAQRWVARLAEALPARAERGVALEVLACCLREDLEPPDAGRLPALIFRGEEEVEAALRGLERAGVLRIDCRVVRLDPDPVLRDVVRALHRREFGGAAPDAVAAAATADAVRALPADAARRAVERFRGALRAVLESWDGRQVPAALLDAAALGPRPEGVGPEELAELGRAGGQASLPRVAAASSGRIGFTTSPAGLEMDAVAWGWRGELGDPEGEVAWVVRRVPAGPGMAAALREFDRAVAALQAAGDLPAARVVRWAVLGGDPDPAAAAAAAELRIATSTFPALRALAALFGVTLPVPDPGRPASPAEVEVEMTIPAAADAELVAARALEQLAELAALAPDEVRRVRTALVEACINAFEHSGSPGTRVRLVFTVARDELRIRVENRGRPFSAAAAARPGGGEGRRRGWGLRLMRELMDRVELEPREDGVTLLMAKRLGGGGGS